MTTPNHLRSIRTCLAIVIFGLVVSGVTAYPLETELQGTLTLLQSQTLRPIAEATYLLPWIARVHAALAATNRSYPFLAYGTDWLAFAHLVIAAVFIGPWRDPVRNQWVIVFGLIACAGVVPLALIAGPIRGIPFAWRLVDCSFALFGGTPLLLCLRHIRALELAASKTPVSVSIGEAP